MTVTKQPPKTKPTRMGKRDAGHCKTPRQGQVDPEMRHLGIGIDTGRHGHHVSFLREDKQCAATPMTVMEKADDYTKLRLRLEQLHQRFPGAHLHLRIDAAGQYADNIEAFVRSLDHLPMTVSVGQPKLNKDYHSVCAPKSQTDKTESYAMARYAVVERPEASYGMPPEFTTLKRIANRLHGQVKQSTRLTNQLHETLSAVFTELATIITNLAAPWVLTMLAKYPTAKRIAAARQSSLLKIPYLTQEKAEKIQKAAENSVSKLSSQLDEELVQELVSELEHSLDKERQWKKLLAKAFDGLPEGPHKRIATIKGIGKQTAAAIVATAISIDRFESDRKLIGYYGVFPRELQSGVDKFGRPIPPGKKIMCRQGNDLVRGLLWQCAKCASGEKGGNPEVRALYLRRIAAGDTAMTAWGYCMTKLLRQVYGVWNTDTDFDPEHEKKRREARQSQRAEVEETNNEAEKETEASGHKDESCSEETEKVVTETPASMEPVYDQPANPHYESSPLIDQAVERPLIDYGELRSQLSMADVLTHIGYPFNASAVQFRGKCPLHDESVGRGKTFSVSFKRDVFRCFESICQKQGNVLDFWCEYRQLPLYEAALDLAKTFKIEIPKKLTPASERSGKKEKNKGGHTPPSH
jgi:transposase